MTKEEIHAVIVSTADALEEQHAVLSIDVAKDAEGFNIPDGSDLSDALRALSDAATRLARLAFKIAREG